MNPFFSALAAWLQQLICRIAESRRVRREMDQLARMSDYELHDIGLANRASAVTAAPQARWRCR